MRWHGSLLRALRLRRYGAHRGNAGIANDFECLPLDLKDVKAAGDLAVRLGAELTIVGPELPLTLGIADVFARRGLALLGPEQKAAQLEGSKKAIRN